MRIGMGVLLAMAVAAEAAPAEACRVVWVEVERTLDRARDRMEDAEEHVTEGHLRAAYREAQRVRRDVRYERGSGARALRERADALQAVIVVRLQGAVDRRRGTTPDEVDKETRDASVAWALETLQARFEASDTPVNEARLAEALALDAATREDAAARLQRLADRDLIPDTYAYRTLAVLQHELGNAELASAAADACVLSASMRELPLCPVFS